MMDNSIHLSNCKYLNMTETARKSFIEGYIKLLEIHSAGGEIGPALPAMALDDDKQLSVFCLMLSPSEAMEHMVNYIKKNKPVEIAFGLDRFSRENQGVSQKYDSVFTIYYMDEKKQWNLGIFPYNKSGEFGEVDWNNHFWKNMLANSTEAFSKLSKEIYD